jgi:excinuclease ABC subunit A
LRDLPTEVFQIFLHGDGREFPGVLTLLEQEYVTATDQDRRDALARFRGQITCPACDGSRLRPEANSVRVGGKTISEICRLPITAAVPFFAAWIFRRRGVRSPSRC